MSGQGTLKLQSNTASIYKIEEKAEVEKSLETS